MPAPQTQLTLEVLQQQDDICSGAVIAVLKDDTAFHTLSETEGARIIQRDAEDEEKLAKGIKISVDKKILPARCEVPPVKKINVIGLSAEEVARSIVDQLPKQEGNIIVLQGLSGTGKGTTVGKLKGLLPRCVTWSNGNVFRCYTLLANEALEAQGKKLTTEALLADPSIIEKAVERVTFKEVSDGVYDIFIDGTKRVKEIENTLLKTPLINSAVPVVAELTQGEVIWFAGKAVKLLSEAGFNIILEGRAQTLSYIYSKERFELVIPEVATLGQRRAAQRVMGRALELVRETPGTNVVDAVKKAVTMLH